MSVLRPKRNTVDVPTAPTAGALATGEIAVNLNDGKWYLKVTSGAVLRLVPDSIYVTSTTSTIPDAATDVIATLTITLTLPLPATVGLKKIFVKNAGTGTVTIQPATGNLDPNTSFGVANVALSSGAMLGFLSDGTSWSIF